MINHGITVKRIFAFTTLKVTLPIGQSFIIALVVFPIFLVFLEFFFRISFVFNNLPPSTVFRTYDYPEMDVKYQKFEILNNNNLVNCVFLGTSMVDQAIDPEIVIPSPNQVDQANCFNFGLQSMMPGTSSVFANALVKKYNIKTIILGISAVDLAGDYYLPRDFIYTPWFRYISGHQSFEGQLIDKSIVYRYLLSLKKYKNPDYQNMVIDLNQLITNHGQNRKDEKAGYPLITKTKFPNYSLDQHDFLGLGEFGKLKDKNVNVIVIEMPVDPRFLPYYVKNGVEGYEEEFVSPVAKLLKDSSIPFIRTQKEIKDVISPEGWVDYAHLNRKGATQFSIWLSKKIVQY
jgi:hypothetical protein